MCRSGICCCAPCCAPCPKTGQGVLSVCMGYHEVPCRYCQFLPERHHVCLWNATLRMMHSQQNSWLWLGWEAETDASNTNMHVYGTCWYQSCSTALIPGSCLLVTISYLFVREVAFARSRRHACMGVPPCMHGMLCYVAFNGASP